MSAKGGTKVDDLARRNAYIEHRIAGVYPTQAARLAGFKNPKESADDMERHPEVRDIVRSAIDNARIEARFTRGAVMEVVEEAINMGRVISDPMAMIRGAQEINKMQGYYAPEAKEITLTGGSKERMTQIQSMSEQELLDRLGKDDAYIDAEFEELNNE